MKSVYVMIALASVVMMPACSKKQQEADNLKPAATSREAAMRVVEAMARHDAPGLLELVDGGAEVKELFRCIIDSMQAADVFRERFIQAYGNDAWKTFQESKPLGNKRPDMKLNIPDFDQMRKDAASWEATTENKGRFEGLQGLPVPLKTVKGGWVIEGDTLFEDKKTIQGLTKTQGTLTAFIRKYTKAIGHPGISSEDIDYQMGKEFMKILMGGELTSKGAPANSNRFDIESVK